MDAKLEQEEYNMIFCEELRVHNDEKKQLDDNMQKAYALIIKNYCSHTMKTRVEDKHDFETNVRDKPIELLKRVKECMHIPTQSKYEYDRPHETIKRFAVDTKQMEDEELTTILSVLSKQKIC